MKRLLILAGEESGVLYANAIAEKVRAVSPDVEIRGYGDYGFETSDLAVFGIFAVLRHIFFFLRVKRTLQRAIVEWKPDAVCTVDYPGLNLKLAAFAKSRGVRTVHVVCPQVWAWHRGRIPKIERSLDKLCCFFPFEPAIFRSGFATFVGHPLVREFERADRADRLDRTVAVLPGSRIGEIEKILPILLKAAEMVSQKVPGAQFVIPAANDRARRRIASILGRRLSPSVHCELMNGGARELLARATCAVVASGTATLEAALARCPTVLVYRVGAVTAMIARRVIKGVRHVGLANVVAEKSGRECPMPELLQENLTPSGVAAYLEAWLTDPAARKTAAVQLDLTMSLLTGGEDPLRRVAQIVLANP